MGKTNKPLCGTCEVLAPYKERCTIPLEGSTSTQDVYLSYDGKTKRCKSVYISRKTTLVTDSHHKFKGTVSVNDGIPTGLWNSVTCRPFINFPVPYIIKEHDGTVCTDDCIVMTQLFDGTSPMTTVANPCLGLDSSTTLIGDSSERFVKGTFPVYPVTASPEDIDNVVTMYKIVSKGSYRIRVTVQATKIVDDSVPDDTLFTKIVAVDDVTSCDYRVPLCFTTFKLCPLGNGAPFGTGDDQVAPTFVTYVKNACGEYSLGLFHGLVATFTGGQVFPDDCAPETINLELPCYTMVGAHGEGCPFLTSADLTEKFGDVACRQYWANATAVEDSPDITLVLTVDGIVVPGELTHAAKDKLVHAMSESLVHMWRKAVNSFNTLMDAYVLAVNPP
jgi:hypothetical protein